MGALGATREASWALLEPFGKRLGRSWSRLGGVLGALGAVWAASWALLELSRRLLGRSGQHFTDMLIFMVFLMFFIDFPGAESLS